MTVLLKCEHNICQIIKNYIILFYMTNQQPNRSMKFDVSLNCPLHNLPLTYIRVGSKGYEGLKCQRCQRDQKWKNIQSQAQQMYQFVRNEGQKCKKFRNEMQRPAKSEIFNDKNNPKNDRIRKAVSQQLNKLLKTAASMLNSEQQSYKQGMMKVYQQYSIDPGDMKDKESNFKILFRLSSQGILGEYLSVLSAKGWEFFKERIWTNMGLQVINFKNTQQDFRQMKYQKGMLLPSGSIVENLQRVMKQAQQTCYNKSQKCQQFQYQEEKDLSAEGTIDGKQKQKAQRQIKRKRSKTVNQKRRRNDDDN